MNTPTMITDDKFRIAALACAVLGAGAAHAATLYNVDIARNRGGEVYNASTDDSALVWNSASPGGSSSMTWNVYSTGTGNLTGATISLSDLDDSGGTTSSYSVSIGPVNTDGYSDQTPRDGVWTSYMTTSAVNGSGPDITIGGFAPGEIVNLVVYTGHARWSGTNTGEFTFGGSTQSYSETGASSSMPLTEGATYLRFDGLVPDGNGDITGSFGALASGQEGLAVFSGLQFEVVPEPSGLALGGFGALALLLLRRRR